VEGVLIDQPEGAVFPMFDPAKHVTTDAEFVLGIPVQIGCDAGTSRTTGAVLFQVREIDKHRKRVTVFADYMAVDVVSEQNARAIRGLLPAVAIFISYGSTRPAPPGLRLALPVSGSLSGHSGRTESPSHPADRLRTGCN
jgi:hypothetical protein